MVGKVYLVGAGPGDYKLMTLKGMECIKEAEVIVYDRLANKDYLKEAQAGCEFIDVGKTGSYHTRTQEEINNLIVERAKAGKKVIRLKGGDPYVFGRGGEEAEYLLEQGIPFEVVPGITSAIGGACYAGIPLTHRDYASSFHVMTGHLRDGEKEEINFKALAALKGTLVFLMGVSNLQTITHNLIEEGKDKTTPVALISWATRATQFVVTGTLENIYERGMEKQIKSPTLIVIGEVVKLREKLNFFENKPLFGKKIVVTRAREQSSGLVSGLEELGAQVIELPTIKIKKIENNPSLDEALKNLKQYTYIIFTSQNSVYLFFEELNKKGKDTRSLAHAKIVAIGQPTVEALKEKGIISDVVPNRAVAEGIYEALSPQLKAEDNILIPQSAIARDYLAEKLRGYCAVTAIKLYDTVVEASDTTYLLTQLEQHQIDYITFTSSSTCTHLIHLLGEDRVDSLKTTKLVAIGPITAQTIKGYGLEVYRELQEHTVEAMIEAIIEDTCYEY